MDNDVLKRFGGTFANELNNALKLNSDHEDRDRMAFVPSTYIDHDSLPSMNLAKKQGLFILSINIQSIGAKFNNLLAFLTILKENGIIIDIINLQETWLTNAWLNDPDNLQLYQIPGYNLLTQGKICCAHGGLFTYVRDVYQATTKPYYKTSTYYEAMFFDITGDSLNSKCTVANVYRPSTKTSDTDADIKAFIDEFEPILEKIDKGKSNLILSGDFNINLLLTNRRDSYQMFFDLLITRGLIPQATLPTRFASKSASLIDNIFVKLSNGNQVISSHIFVSKLSDHLPLITCLDVLKRPEFRPKFVFIQENSPESIQKFVSDVEDKINKTKFYTNYLKDPNANYSTFEKIISESREKHLPYKRKKFKKYVHKLSPWMTKEILDMIKEKDKLYKNKTLEEPNSHAYLKAKLTFKNYSDLLKHKIKEAKDNFYHKKFDEYKGDARKTWSTINDVLARKKVKKAFPEYFLVKNHKYTNKQAIANEFNEFFTGIGPKLSQEIKSPENLSYKSFLIKTISSEFNFKEMNANCISKIIVALASKLSCGHDDLSSMLLKQLARQIAPILTIIINQSLFTGIFPSKLKIAKVLPLYKKEDCHVFGNYRPISLLPTVSKIFEKVVYKQVYDYFTTNDLFYKSQYGFRQRHSTELAALELSDRLYDQLDNGEIPIAIFLDLSKAFDTLDHEILLEKLRYYGIGGSALKWFHSYLSNRQQYIVFDGTTSKRTYLTTGVPQGSVLGPLLFLIYMNDISEASKKFHSVLFADDTTLSNPLRSFDMITTGNTYDQTKLSDNINAELHKVYEWLSVNKLSLNVGKTKFMIFHYRQRNISSLIPILKINNNIIKQVTEFDFLGTIFDQNLNWNKHVQKVANKVSRTIGLLNRLKRILPQNTLKLIYNSLVLPHFQYGILNWGHNCSRLIKLQKRAMRSITCSRYNAHVVPILKELKLLRFEDIHKIALLKFQFRYQNNTLPEYFKNIFTLETPDHDHDTRGRNIDRPPVPNRSFSKNTVRHFMPIFLQNTPNIITDKISTHSLKGFTNYAKRYYIDNYNFVCNDPNCWPCQYGYPASYNR